MSDEASSYSILDSWTPKTMLGRLVKEGKISSLEEIFQRGFRIREPEIVDVLLPRLTEEVISIDLVQKQTDAGERNRFRALAVVGDMGGHVGLGRGKAVQVRDAIEKAVADAKKNIIVVRRGCGSWECRCNSPHSLPFIVEGSCGSVRVKLMPGPRGLGLVIGDTAKTVLRMAGIQDCWSFTRGSTSTAISFANATFEALKKTATTLTPELWGV